MKEYIRNSPNHYNGRYGWKPDIVVMHQTGGTTASAALKWYLNSAAQCSPNDVIDTNGDIYHLVDYDNAAYCNGTQTAKPNEKLYYKNAISKLVKSRKANANFYTYSIEFVHCARGNITEAQIKAAVWLLKNRIIPHMEKNGVKPQIDREHIIGHCDIDPVGRSFCPGKNFPYSRIISEVLAEEYDIKSVMHVYQSLGKAAIRSAPDNSVNNIEKRCEKGAYYAIKGILRLNGVTWLVHADNSGYSMLKDGTALFRHCGSYKLYKTTDYINIRSAPKIELKNVLGQLEANSEVYVGTTTGKWTKIIYDGKVCYAHRDYLKKM